MKHRNVTLTFFLCGTLLAAITAQEGRILPVLDKVAQYQLHHPTGKALYTWEYAPFYMGLFKLYQLTQNPLYYHSILEMGYNVNWEPRPRPYDANVLAISQVFFDLYVHEQAPYIIDKSQYIIDMTITRWLEPDIRFEGNKYWWEWWSWCDALFMAPPAYAQLSQITGDSRYVDFMVDRWKLSSDYLYSRDDSLFFRDDRFFAQTTPGGKKIFWSRGNGWVVGGLVRVLEHLPEQHPDRAFFMQQLTEMCHKLAHIQLENGFWGPSLYDVEHYAPRETSGTAFFIYAMAWGVNQGVLDKNIFIPVIERGWEALLSAIDEHGRVGYVQKVGDAPDMVKPEHTESYGSGALLLAGCEVYLMRKINGYASK